MRLATICLVSVGATSEAQQATPADTVAPLVRVDVSGPAAWRTRFLPTNLGSMLASAEGEKLIAPWIDELDALWANAAGGAQQAARARVLAFGGRLRIGLWADAAAKTQQSMSGAIVLDAAPVADLEAIAADLSPCLRLLPQRSELIVDGEKFTVARNDRAVCTLPRTFGDQVAVFVAQETGALSDAVHHGLRWCRAPSPTSPTSAAPLRVDLDLAGLAAMNPETTSAQVFAPLGFASLAHFVFTLSADGPHVCGDFVLGFGDGERGLFAGLFPDRAGVPALADLVPDAVTGWQIGRFDPGAIWRAAVRASAVHRGKDEAAVRADAKAQCNGIDIGAQILALLRDEILVVWRDVDTDDEDSRHLALCLVMPAKDEKALRAAMAQLVATSDMEITETDGVWRAAAAANWLFPPIHLAVGRGLACAAIGEGSGAQVDAILSRAKIRAPAPPAEVDLWRKRAPAGFNGVSVLTLETFLRRHLDVLTDALAEVAPIDAHRGSELATGVQAWLPLLTEHGLLRLTALTGCADARWHLRVLW